jgi:hypothetical protein
MLSLGIKWAVIIFIIPVEGMGAQRLACAKTTNKQTYKQTNNCLQNTTHQAQD